MAGSRAGGNRSSGGFFDGELHLDNSGIEAARDGGAFVFAPGEVDFAVGTRRGVAMLGGPDIGKKVVFI